MAEHTTNHSRVQHDRRVRRYGNAGALVLLTSLPVALGVGILLRSPAPGCAYMLAALVVGTWLFGVAKTLEGATVPHDWVPDPKDFGGRLCDYCNGTGTCRLVDPEDEGPSSRHGLCPACSGSGHTPAPPAPCPQCHRLGMVSVAAYRLRGGYYYKAVQCPTCNGTGAAT